MYLMLTTQGVDCEIGTKFDQYQMTEGMGNVIQTDIKLNKGLIKWREKHDVKPTVQSFDFNTCLGIAKSIASSYSIDYGFSQFDDAYNSALEGVSNAFIAWNQDTHDTFKSFVRICCRNAVYGEFRKVKRWSNEVAESRIKTEEEEDIGFMDNQPSGLWQDESKNPEEECIRAEEIKMAREKVNKLQSGFNERELYVLWNHIIADEPTSLREIASQFQVDKSSIYRDVVRIRKQLEIKET